MATQGFAEGVDDSRILGSGSYGIYTIHELQLRSFFKQQGPGKRQEWLMALRGVQRDFT